MKPGKHQDDDAELFSDAMKDVKPLAPHNLAEPGSGIGSRPARTSYRPDDTDEDDPRGFIKGGIQKAELRKLRTGQIPIEAELDLHGRTAAEAEQELRTFLRRMQAQGRQRAVRVIHGKGRGSPNQKSILKDKVTDWLRESDAVLAFCQAGPTDGGTGAVRILLRRR